MPAINVSRTDTFENQRQKINDIGANLFSISQGGSDLSTGNLKLGDGTRGVPSLSFINEASLGIFRPDVGRIGFVSAGKNLFDITTTGQVNYKNLIVQKRVISTSDLEITNSGSNYDSGTYEDIAVLGGTGEGATFDIEVTEFVGTITNNGDGYTGGNYSGVAVTGGNGSGAEASLTIDGIDGDITVEGSAYTPGVYSDVILTGGSGSFAEADITVNGDTIFTGNISSAGSNYTDSVYSDVALINVPVTTYTVTVVSNPGSPPPDNIYQIDSLDNPTLTFEKGNTYKFDLSSATLSGHPFALADGGGLQLGSDNYSIIETGAQGNADAALYITVGPNAATETLQYVCQVHTGMGNNISVQAGTPGNGGDGIRATVEISGGSVTAVTITDSGENYEIGDTLFVNAGDVQSSLSGGSGFLYTLAGISYTGVVSNISVTEQGTGYQKDDVLSASDSNLGGGGGSGFQFTVTTNPGKVSNINFDLKGTGYQAGNVLGLGGTVTGVTGVTNGTVSDLSVTLGTGTSFSVPSAIGIAIGQGVTSSIIETGQVAAGTTVTNVVGNTVTISAAPDTAGTASLTFASTGNATDIIVSSLAGGIGPGYRVTVTSGSGVIPSGATINSIDASTNTITLSVDATSAGDVTLSFSPPWGTPTTDFEFTVDSIGAVNLVDVNNGGNGYSRLDTLTVDGTNLVQPITRAVTVQDFQELTFVSPPAAGFIVAGDTLEYDDGIIASTGVVAEVTTGGGNITSVLVESLGVDSGDNITKQGNATTLEIASANDRSKFYIDGVITPNLTVYVGNTYLFDTSDSSNGSHNFALSSFDGGSYYTVNDITTTLAATSRSILVASTTGIFPGMAVIASGDGTLSLDTVVESVDSGTQLTLSDNPSGSGAATLTFTGTSYTDGVVNTGDGLRLKVTTDTPTLYYFCTSGGSDSTSSHAGMGGGAQITIDPNNPKTFGSGLLVTLTNISDQDVITLDVLNGKVIAQDLDVENGTIDDLTVDTLISTKTINVQQKVITDEVESASTLVLDSSDLTIEGNVTVGNSKLTITNTNGNLVTQGNVRANAGLNVNNILTIADNEITTTGTSDITMIPALNRVAKVDTSTALVIPIGTTGQRPITPIAQDGAIRFNTETNSYEGYSSTNAQWSSLGGVRDLDGNTTILAEETVGANDNTLWFINDGVNTIKVSPNYLEFVNVKKVKSVNVSAPTFTSWAASSPVSLGDFLKYQNNIYEVTSVDNPGGTNLLAVSGSEPTHTSGDATSGDVTLTWYVSAVSPLTFDEISEVKIDPLGFTSLSVNNQLKFSGNTMSSFTNDIVISPNGSQKVEIDCQSSLVLPVGDNNSKGNPIQGSIRYNTDDSQFEGYNGAQWGGLGGVKDIDQDTLIKAEVGPGTDEDILYFFNAGSNSMRLSSTAMSLDSIDTIESVSEVLNLNGSLLGISSLALNIDHTVADTSFIYSTKDKLDIGLSSGLNNDHLLRLTNTGDIIYNLGFTTGTPNNITLLDDELTNLDLSHFRLNTSRLTLTRQSGGAGNATLYNLSTESSGKVLVTAVNTTTGSKEIVEYNVIDDGTDLYYTEINNIKSGVDIITSTFDIDGLNNSRITVTLDSALGLNDNVEITFVKTITKR
tara:strand:+ start:8785 stop:13638 length:4854 start_codon:yes stop_codon:yes gene_type:complete